MIKLVLGCLLAVCSLQYLYAQKTEEICYNPNLIKDTTKKSIKSAAFAMIGDDSLKIVYHSPGVRKRIIWGGLVPFGEVWVTGAHDATTLQTPKTLIIDRKELQPGKYALFTIPDKKSWTIIINKNWEQHLASEYDEKDDLIRFKVKPKNNVHTERLMYTLELSQTQFGLIAIAWEKIKIEIPFEVK